MSRFESIPPALPQTGLSKKAYVYVSTEAVKQQELEQEQAHLQRRGKWFSLSNYANKAEFIEDATNFAIIDLLDESPKLVFSGFDAGFEKHGLVDYSNNEPSDDLWTVFTLSDEDLAILHSYSTFHVSLDGGVKGVMEAARDDYIGHFANDRAFVTHKLYEAGATDDVINLLGDACDWAKLAKTLNYGFMHNGHYFNI